MFRLLKSVASAAAALALAGCVTEVSSRTGSVQLVQAQDCDAMLDSQRSSFVLYEVRTGRVSACNFERAQQRFTPASTFKIAHALAALEAGVVENENSRFEWDGRPRGVAAWDKDTSLAEAIAPSTVWVFQTIAERLGHAREAAIVRRLGYGNENIGSPAQLRTFWLSGPLAISAQEQVSFLAKLRSGELAASRDNQTRTVALLRMRECGPRCTLYGKTGAMLPIDEQGFLRPHDNGLLPPGAERTGWFVGWIERPEEAGGPIVFAHNLDLALPNAMAARTAVAFQLLRANGVPISGDR